MLLQISFDLHYNSWTCITSIHFVEMKFAESCSIGMDYFGTRANAGGI